MKRHEQLTIVILSEEEGKEFSARHALRCIGRDFRFLFAALGIHCRKFFYTINRNYGYVNHWWKRQ